MLVSQMQPCRNANFPQGVPFGVGCLHVAEIAARLMGFGDVVVYSARGHPIFKEHPENWGQFGPEFVEFYDNSSRKLGFDGSRSSESVHSKSLRPS